jgi:hypothetical protein
VGNQLGKAIAITINLFNPQKNPNCRWYHKEWRHCFPCDYAQCRKPISDHLP